MKPVRIAAINGRSVDDMRYLWGDIATQLGKEEDFRGHWVNGPKSMSEADWIRMLGDAPTLILLDELAPYFDVAVTKIVGNGSLVHLLKYSLANLFSAAMNLKNVVIVMSSLNGSYQTASREIMSAMADLAGETRRGAKSITPVDLSTNEIYAILRKRLFSRLPGDEEIDLVAKAFSQAIGEAVKGKALEKSSEQIADEVVGSYPFHPSFKDILALFKENEKFRQTRGLIEFSANLLRSAFAKKIDANGKAREVYLIGVQHFDFTDMASRDQVRGIAASLESAMAQDVFDADGSAHAQCVDEHLGSDAGSMVAGLIFISSLSDNMDGIKGLDRHTILQYLIAPGRPASEFSDAFDELRKHCWYLHSKDGDKFYFSDIANLKKRLDDRAARAPIDRVDAEVKRRLEEIFRADSKVAYSEVIALPEVRDVKLTAGRRICLVLSPDTKAPPEAAQRFFEGSVFKNVFCVVTGDGTPFGVLQEKAKRLWAIAKVKEESSGDPRQRKDLDNENAIAEMDFTSTVTSLLTRVWYPAFKDGDTLRNAPLNLSSHQEKGRLMGEKAVEAALSATGASKLIVEPGDNLLKLVTRAEEMLFDANTSRIPWSLFIERAATRTRWPWLPPKGLEDIRKFAVERGRWSFGSDQYVDCRPPLPRPSIKINTLRQDETTGISDLQLIPSNAGTSPEVWVSDSPDVFGQGRLVDGDILSTRSVELWFACRDASATGGEEPEVKKWTGKLFLTHNVQLIGDDRLVTLSVVPSGQIRWNTTGANEKEAGIYDGEAFKIDGEESVTIFAYASSGAVETKQRFVIDPVMNVMGSGIQVSTRKFPVRTKSRRQFGSKEEVFKAIDASKAEPDLGFSEIRLTIGTDGNSITIASQAGVNLTGQHLEDMIANIQSVIPNCSDDLSLVIGRITFDNELALSGFCKKTGQNLSHSDLEAI